MSKENEKLEKDISELEKAVETLASELEKASGTQEALKAREAELEKAEEDLAVLKEQLAEAQAIAKLSDAAKAYIKGMDEDKKKKFLELSEEDQEEEVEKHVEAVKKADETLVVDGQTIHKSQVGAAQFAIFKAQQARIEKAEADVKKAQDEAAMVGFEKRAKEELGNLPGEALAKAAVLKSIAAMPEAERKTLEAMLKAGDGAIKSAFDRIGHNRGGSNQPAAKAFEKRVDEIQAANPKMAKTDVLKKARTDYPDEFAAAQAAQNQPVVAN